MSSFARTARFARRALASACTAALLSGCAASLGGTEGHVTPVVGAPVTDNHTPYSACLGSLASLPAQNSPVIAVGDIQDKTGQRSNDTYNDTYNDSTMLTQGVSEMLIKTGRVQIAERMDPSIQMTEKQLAEMGLLTAPALP